MFACVATENLRFAVCIALVMPLAQGLHSFCVNFLCFRGKFCFAMFAAWVLCQRTGGGHLLRRVADDDGSPVFDINTYVIH